MGITGRNFVEAYLSDSLATLDAFARDAAAVQNLSAMANVIGDALEAGNKVLIAGNGGSAADAQHIAGELLSRLFFDRSPLPAIALTTDTSVLTAIGNDYGYEKIFERQVLGLGRPGDIFLGISTSGKSPNVMLALDAAKARGLVTIGFTGAAGGEMAGKCDHILKAPSAKTSIIQQIHIVAAHIVCALVEERLFGAARRG